MIAHWPNGIAGRGEFRRTSGHVIDIVPTIVELAGGKPTTTLHGKPVPPSPGRSLVPAFAADKEIERDSLWWSHEGHRALRIGDWKLVAAKGDPWELFDLSKDRSETRNLAAKHAGRVQEMAKMWKAREDSFLELVKR
jgi:arylsulfatase